MVQVLLPAAGESARLAPFSDKNTLSFFGKPLLAHAMERLKRYGFRQIIVVGGKQNLALLKKISKPYRATVVQQRTVGGGIGSALLAAAPRIRRTQPLLVLNAHDLVDDDALDQLVASMRTHPTESLLLAKKVSAYFPGGYVKAKSNGRITAIIEKPGAGAEPSNLVTIVCHLHRDPAQLLKTLSKLGAPSEDRYERAMTDLIDRGLPYRAVPFVGVWQPIKFPWHILPAWRFFHDGKRRISAKARIAKTAVVRGPVVMEDDVQIFDHATVVGPAYLGRGVVVGNNALVRESHVGAGSVVGFSSEVARSYLGENVWLHSNYIGDSVLGNNVALGAGSITGNFRLDEANVQVAVGEKRMDTGSNKIGAFIGNDVRIGIRVSLMPGVKIGAGSFVGAGIVVARDVPDGMFVTGTWDLTMKENRATAQIRKRL